MPTRPTTSALLWGHLLSQDPTVSSSGISSVGGTGILPPTTPADKAGTSLRILLHDTQANLEKFSERVSKLSGGVEEASRGISTVQTLFLQDREKLLDDVVSLVNRCQSEIQRSICHPAQADKVEELRTEIIAVDRRVDALDRKMDALQMVNQTQLQALQALQEQQTQILTMLAPMLPLLQVVPIHLDNTCNQIKDQMRVLAFPNLPQQTPLRQQNPESCPSLSAHSLGAQERDLPVSSDQGHRRKKRKLDARTSSTQSPAQDSENRTDEPASLHVDQGISPLNPSTSSKIICPPPPPQHVHKIPRAPQTPRRPPLAESFLLNNAPVTPAHRPSPLSQNYASDCMSSMRSNQPHSNPILANDPGSARNLYNPADAGPKSGSSPLVPLAMQNKISSLTSSTSTLSEVSNKSQNGPIDPSTPFRLPMLPNSALSSCPGVHPATMDAQPRTQTQMSNLVVENQPSTSSLLNPMHSRSRTPVRRQLQGPGMSSYVLNMTPTSAADKAMTIKDRRAMFSTPAFKEEKRFIPLDDDEDGD